MRTVFILTLAWIGTAALWLVWLHLKLPPEAWFLSPLLMHKIGLLLPLEFPVQSQWPQVIASLAALIFLLRVTWQPRKEIVTVWFTGLAALWITANTLLMPWIDPTRSYGPIFKEMQAFVDNTPYKEGCVNSVNLGESIAPMWQYFSPAHRMHGSSGFFEGNCPLILTVMRRADPPNPDPHALLLWRGHRLLDTGNEELRLYVRQ